MTDSPNTADIVERLGYYRQHLVTGALVLRNPDGPEAAALITTFCTIMDKTDAEGFTPEIEQELMDLRSTLAKVTKP